MSYPETSHVLMAAEYHVSLVHVFHSFAQESLPGLRVAWIMYVVSPVLLRLTHAIHEVRKIYYPQGKALELNLYYNG